MTDYTTLSNEELSRAVAERCGWVILRETAFPQVPGYPLWQLPDGHHRATKPLFAESMDACLEPGGPVEWLRRKKLLWSGHQLAVGGFLSVIQAELPELHSDELRWSVVHDAEADTLPRALCLAFLAATEASE